MNKLKDRYDQYSEISNQKLLSKVPLIININGKGFHNTTSLLDKPFDINFFNCLESTMKKLCSEIEGATIGYCFNDNIVIISRNDQNINTIPWFNNNIQKLNSISSSIATSHFTKYSTNIGMQLMAEPYFYSKVYAVPNEIEALNMFIFYQQLNLLTSLNFSCYYSMLNKFDKVKVKDIIKNLSQIDKIEMLESEFGINFNSLNSKFRFGSLCVKNENKWEVITSPIISQKQEIIKKYI